METLAIINAVRLGPNALKPFADGPSAFSRVIDYARTFASRVVVLADEGGPGLGGAATGVITHRREGWTMASLLEAVAGEASAHPGADAILYAHGDAPFMDAGLSDELLAMHRRYRAEYTFADGYPPGFAPELLASRSLPNLAALAARHDAPADRDGLFAVIQKDINSFDIETKLSPADLREYRLSPVCDTRRNTLAAERLWAVGARTAEDAARLIPETPGLLRTLPAFLWVQVAEGCPQACSYCPYPAMVGDPRGLKGFMPPERFEALMAQAEDLCDDLVVDLSLWGEPGLHPDFASLARSVLRRPRFTLLVETSGLGWRPGLAESLAREAGERIQWIVSLDDADDAGYASLRGEGRDEAASFAERLLRAAPGSVHLQAVRMRDNEAGLEAFYRGWKKREAKVIIQKYDTFAGALPERGVADLSPLKRLPCRHLARDMAVLLDGTVPACKHCLERSGDGLSYAMTVGNAFSDGLAAAWEAMEPWYGRHAMADYPSICGRCDEYHTFNA